eukprot:CAMPEP_0170170962 /NCGR_PEP_ID=MMETSP0040_2-20121228/4010_1 /TAXON_ID=641309 /ORGANISM="Lotharella oceanica, Strain CCMP622" /LENGTH=64 /DNA_ID=CAMNT_0010410699 /DNA_START=171 /DNA_END=362 /DNA_ORIENTATION=-
MWSIDSSDWMPPSDLTTASPSTVISIGFVREPAARGADDLGSSAFTSAGAASLSQAFLFASVSI